VIYVCIFIVSIPGPVSFFKCYLSNNPDNTAREEAVSMAKVKATNANSLSKLRPALSPDAREGQMAALAMDLVEQRLRDGTASSQETTHFLKLVSSKARLEQERLKLENELVAAKTKALANAEEIKVLYEEALKAMRRYGGHGEEDEYEY
jgi:hypothetical protein